MTIFCISMIIEIFIKVSFNISIFDDVSFQSLNEIHFKLTNVS